MKAHNSGMFCFIPPHIYENILESGSIEQRQKALNSLILSGQMRGRRQALRRIRFPFPHSLLSGKRAVCL